MTILRVLDVIKIRDEWIKPPAPKFVVCIEPLIPLFVRINSADYHDGSVSIPLEGHRTFLKYDSFIECSAPLSPDDFIIHAALEKHGIVGRVDPVLSPDIAAAVLAKATISRNDKLAICRALGVRI